jgi:hypothetical protein
MNAMNRLWEDPTARQRVRTTPLSLSLLPTNTPAPVRHHGGGGGGTHPPVCGVLRVLIASLLAVRRAALFLSSSVRAAAAAGGATRALPGGRRAGIIIASQLPPRGACTHPPPLPPPPASSPFSFGRTHKCDRTRGDGTAYLYLYLHVCMYMPCVYVCVSVCVRVVRVVPYINVQVEGFFGTGGNAFAELDPDIDAFADAYAGQRQQGVVPGVGVGVGETMLIVVGWGVGVERRRGDARALGAPAGPPDGLGRHATPSAGRPLPPPQASRFASPPSGAPTSISRLSRRPHLVRACASYACASRVGMRASRVSCASCVSCVLCVAHMGVRCRGWPRAQMVEGLHRAGPYGRAGDGGKVRNRLGVMAHHFEPTAGA